MSNDNKTEAQIFSFPTNRISRPEAVGDGEIAKNNAKAAADKSKKAVISQLAKSYSAAIVRECAIFGVGVDYVNDMVLTGKIPKELNKHLCLLHLAIEATICRLDRTDNDLDETIDKLVPDDADSFTVSAGQINKFKDDKTRAAVQKFLNGYDKSPDNINKLISSLRKAVSN